MREDFLRRYATSPLHVARLERLLATYGDTHGETRFAETFIAFDRACPDVNAALVLTEVLATFEDESGALVRLSDQAIQGALRFLTEAVSVSPTTRAYTLRTWCRVRDTAAIKRVRTRLEAAADAPTTELEQLLEHTTDSALSR